MNPYIKNLNRLEFVITMACTGRCKHCSEGDHTNVGEHIDGEVAANMIRKVASHYNITSLMTFGGEPLLHPEDVCKIHRAAKEAGIQKRQLITNGFFSRNEEMIKRVANELALSGVNDVLLSVDAFHQETIPLDEVKIFAKAVKETGVLIRTQPAWLVGKNVSNPYNDITIKILEQFKTLGIDEGEGNVIFPSGNALKYLKEYFDLENPQISPYEENPMDIKSISVNPDGSVLGGNIYTEDILEIIKKYKPKG